MKLSTLMLPYPVANSNRKLSGYINTKFCIKMEYDKNGSLIRDKQYIYLKNIRFELKNKELEALYKKELIKCSLIVESTSSVYREKFNLTTDPQNIKLNISNLYGNVEISAYMYPVEEIKDFTSKDFRSAYTSIKFDIKKNEILAADDGIEFNARVDYKEYNKPVSIFSVIKSEENIDIIKCVEEGNKIYLYFPEQYYIYYENLISTDRYNNIFFSMLLLGPFVEILEKIKCNSEDKSIESIIDEHPWFKSVITSYKNIYKKDMNYSDFMDLSSYELAQKLLNNAACNGLKDFYNFTEEEELDEK